jgi:predicted component of type VI protein secretion system
MMLWRNLPQQIQSFSELQQDVQHNLRLLLCHQQCSALNQCGLHTLGLPDMPLYLDDGQQVEQWLRLVTTMLTLHEPRLLELTCEAKIERGIALLVKVSGYLLWQDQKRADSFNFKLMQGYCYDD